MSRVDKGLQRALASIHFNGEPNLIASPLRRHLIGATLLCFTPAVAARADEPKPKPENTIAVRLSEPVAPQVFPHPPKFFIAEVTDRSGNPQPMLVYKPRGGIFLDRQPTEITREALEMSLKAAGMLAADRESADLLLQVYLFHFGLESGSGLDFFGKVELAVMVKNPKTGKSQQVGASGTSIAGAAVLKKNIQKNVQENIEKALSDALRNFLRGSQLRKAVLDLSSPAPSPASAPAGVRRSILLDSADFLTH